jgi:hypothetical protein
MSIGKYVCKVNCKWMNSEKCYKLKCIEKGALRANEVMLI